MPHASRADGESSLLWHKKVVADFVSAEPRPGHGGFQRGWGGDEEAEMPMLHQA